MSEFRDRVPPEAESAEGLVLAALLDDDEDRTEELLRQFMRGELVNLRHTFTVGRYVIDRILKDGDWV